MDEDGSEQSKGRSTGKPYHQKGLQTSHIKRATKLAGLRDEIGWHTFRQTYRCWVDEKGAAMKVQQEFTRHASIQSKTARTAKSRSARRGSK